MKKIYKKVIIAFFLFFGETMEKEEGKQGKKFQP